MADGKIYITISDERKGGGPGQPSPSIDTTTSEDKDSFSLATYAGTMLLNTIKNNAVKAVNYSINNIGNFTGDYRTQRDVSEAMQLGESLMSIGKSFIAGTIMSGGNPIAGLIAAGANMIGQGINFALQEKSAQFAIKKQNHEIEQIRNLSGLNSLRDGSRGTLD